jgi:hypothetical protein
MWMLAVRYIVERVRKDWYLGIEVQYNSTYPEAGYLDRLGPSGKFVENSTNLTFLEITGYLIKYSTVLWLLELQITRGHKD